MSGEKNDFPVARQKILTRRWLLLALLAALLFFALPPLFRLGLRTFGFSYYGLPVPPVSLAISRNVTVCFTERDRVGEC